MSSRNIIREQPIVLQPPGWLPVSSERPRPTLELADHPNGLSCTAKSPRTTTRKTANGVNGVDTAPAPSKKRTASARQASLPPPVDDLPLNTATAVMNDARRSKRARTSEPPEPKPKRHAGQAVKAAAAAAGPAKERPLFSARATRANFNPLPQLNPLTSVINDRCGNPINESKVAKLTAKPTEDRIFLIFGSGDMAQMGLGAENMDSVLRAKVHPTVDELRQKGDLGPQGVTHMAAGGLHSMLVDANGKTWSWGVNDAAALGRQTEGVEGVLQEELESTPGQVAGLPERFVTARVAAGDSVSVAVSNRGELRAWGNFRVSRIFPDVRADTDSNASSQANEGILGFDGNVGTADKQLVPLRVQNVSQWPVAQVSCGYNHVLALTTEGSVYTWGTGQQHQLGRKVVERRLRNGLFPERLGLKKVVLVGTGGHHSFAVTEDGTVYAWGLNTWRQLGIDPAHGGNDDIVSIPTPVAALHPSRHGGARVIAIHGGDFFTAFLLNNGEVWAVGSFENSEVGLPDSHPAIVAQRQRIRDGKAQQAQWIEKEMELRKQVAAENGETWDQTKELTESADAAYKAASLGLVPSMSIATPTKIDFPDNAKIVDLSAGPRNVLAVDSKGNAYSWGMSENEALGFGADVDQQETPRLIKSKDINTGIKILKCEAGAYASLLIGVKRE